MAIVWPCPLSVDAYVAAGRDVEVPRPDCPRCGAATTWWSGYWRFVRAEGVCRAIFVPRVRCCRCERTDALLPAFVLSGRLDVVETIGEVISEVVDGGGGVRPVASRVDVPHTTARGWVRRFVARGVELSVAFVALAVDLGGAVVSVVGDSGRCALGAIGAAFGSACALAGWAVVGLWRFVSAVSGGRLIATNTNSPYLVVGSRRFMAPVP
jgi:hypothetical protein